MFNGLIRHFGKVKAISTDNLKISSNICEEINAQIGDSIAINGVCLSVTERFNEGFSVNISTESLRVIAPFKLASMVHLEPAMRLSDRLDGHLLQGHIDSLGQIMHKNELACGVDLIIKVLNKSAAKFIANKGSIGINGVSLTVNEVFNDEFRLTLIPITLEKTLLGSLNKGDLVNIETDLLARYVQRILNYSKEHQGVINAALY